MKKLNLPFISDRYTGFTIPRGGTFHICDHDAVWLITLGPEPSVHETDLDPYKFVEDRTDFLGLIFEGLQENPPLLRVGENAISYDFKPTSDKVIIRFSVAARSGEIEFPIFSQDWFSASFSDDGRYLILAEPDQIEIYDVQH
jgi:hypothetical protein